MKNLYTLLIMTLVTVGASAQYVAQPATASKTKTQRRATQNVMPNVERDVFWTNDFSDCADWDIDNAANNGFGQFVDDLDFECGTPVPEGFAPIDPIASTTADNGYMMVDSDEYGGEEGGTGIENCWFQTVESIDCTDHPFVSIDFQTFYRMWDGGSSDGNEYCLVEVSRDGTTWPDADTFEESEGMVDFLDGDGPVQARYEVFPEMETQDPVDNPTLITFDITEVAGGQETIWLRFRWKGTWGYAWMVDDIEVYDTPANDLRMENYFSATDVETTGFYDNGVWHDSQSTEVQMAARVSNIGTDTQTNTVLAVSVNGTEVATSDPMDMEYAQTDTLRALGYTIPTATGLYDITYSVSADQEDENPSNNTREGFFYVDDVVYGRDNYSITGIYPPTTYNDDFGTAVGYDFFADGMIYGIQVAFADGLAETEIAAQIFDGDLEDVGPGSEIHLMNDIFYNTGDEAPEDIIWTNIMFEDPFEVFAGDFYAAGFNTFAGEGVRILESQFAPDNTCWVYGDLGSNGLDWYFTNEVPMVRLIMTDGEETSVAVNEVEALSFDINVAVPNPAAESTQIVYTLDNASEVVVEVRGLNGQLIEMIDLGTVSAGSNRLVLDVADYASGMYQYTFNVNGERATGKLIVK